PSGGDAAGHGRPEDERKRLGDRGLSVAPGVVAVAPAAYRVRRRTRHGVGGDRHARGLGGELGRGGRQRLGDAGGEGGHGARLEALAGGGQGGHLPGPGGRGGPGLERHGQGGGVEPLGGGQGRQRAPLGAVGERGRDGRPGGQDRRHGLRTGDV